MLIVCILAMNGCESSNVKEDTVNATEEIVDWSEYYQSILASNTSEAVNQIITGDFEGNGNTQAFIITTPQPLDLNESSLIDDFFCVSSLWYLNGEVCQNVYLDENRYYVICESGYIQGKMVIAIGTLTAWAPEQNYDSTVWYVSDGVPKNAGEMVCVYAIEDGYLLTCEKSYGEDEEGIYRALFEYAKFSFDNGTISFVESYIE